MFDTSMRLTWPRWPSSASSNNGDESPGDNLGATSDGAATAGSGGCEVVEVFKPRAGIRIGISLMRSCPAHPTVRTVVPGSLAAQRRSEDAPIISTFDRILAINGDKPRTARDAAAMIRDAQGCVRIRLLRRPPVFVTDSALKLQRRWRQRRGSLAYKRCRPGLLGWLERAQIRLGAYGPDGAARQRDLEEFEGDCALAAIHA
ncbi:hypothetical protein EMIHUDRAFT_445111 [Emiliania huxleyi CCMP1516]|uniref:PDZ domain-containing protein n=2 Tax=Emiliania huxleyi TaxID=2903 RepID=A0A0D3J4Z7_EMIH1|nr:hypothetical protein EMIHUDRAFT_445111 [Emiliania huxleyi CCMP1516]EOD18582.1 hypothetical protein EMIHUDRAFT_445111 [Emiliania huxleyi CCMP1516]|eukprot:XP_005771011.1 hypothetical protein EMIHUDRAFT_445111 [Emiliania huxleyi CCMP1516]